MGDAIGQTLPTAVAIAISPLPIVAIVLMLVTPRGRVNGSAFALGWIVGLAIVGAIVLALASGADASDDGEPATWVSILKLVLGLLALLLGVRHLRGRRGRDEAAATPATIAQTGIEAGEQAIAYAVFVVSRGCPRTTPSSWRC